VSPTAITLILIAAVAHATWNLFTKQASVTGGTSFVWLISLAAAALYAPVVAVSLVLSPPRLTALSWVFLAGTGLLQVGYFLFLQSGYRLGDLSLVYPVGRGSGALLAALAGIVLLGERPGPAGMAGIVLVVLGVLTLGVPGGSPPPGSPPAGSPPARRALVFALVTGVFIATYTLWDKYAVSTLKVPALLQGYASVPVMALVLAPFALRARPRTARVWHDFPRQVAGAAVLYPLAYILVLAAMSFTAVSAVAPAREVSVLAGVLLGRRMLGEGGLARRLTAAVAIAAGIVCIALG
jgi:drug/metabolite transporter (DMT)-like permease